jgi:hypothetical protein
MFYVCSLDDIYDVSYLSSLYIVESYKGKVLYYLCCGLGDGKRIKAIEIDGIEGGSAVDLDHNFPYSLQLLQQKLPSSKSVAKSEVQMTFRSIDSRDKNQRKTTKENIEKGNPKIPSSPNKKFYCFFYFRLTIVVFSMNTI